MVMENEKLKNNILFDENGKGKGKVEVEIEIKLKRKSLNY